MPRTADAPQGGGAQASGPVPAGWRTEGSLALMVVIWGVNFAVVKRALEAFDPLGFNALRFLLASAFVWAVLRARGGMRRPAREDLPRVLLLGLVGNVLYQLAFILGLDRTRAGNASLMLALVPVIVLLGSLRDGEDRPGRAAWTGTVLSVLGVALVSRGTLRLEGTDTLVGDLIMIGAATAWAGYTVGARPLIRRYGSVATTAWTLWAGAVGVVLIGLPSLLQQSWGRVGPAAWSGLLYSAWLSIGLAYLIWNRGVERIGGSRTAVFGNITPIIAVATGALWLGERLTPVMLVGAALVVGGVALVRR